MAMRPVICFSFLLYTVFNSAILTTAEPPVNNDIQKQLTLNIDSKLKRQNEGEVEGIGGEEVDLAGIPGNGQPSQPGQPTNPQQPGQNPFIGNGNGFFPQQPFFGNGLGFNGSPQNGLGFNGSPQNGLGFNGSPQTGLGFNGSPQNGFPQGGVFNQGFPQGFTQGGVQGFPQGVSQGFPQGAFQQNYPQFGSNGRNVILQNNGKQYLVQPLTANQRIVQKNGKQYLLQPLTSSAGLAGIQTFNVPNSALSGLSSAFPQNNGNAALALGPPNGFVNANAALTASAGASQAANVNFPPFSPAVAAVQPSAVTANGKLTSTAPQRLIVGANGNQFEVSQIPIRNGDNSPFLSSAIGAVAAQLASQTQGQQYTAHFLPFQGNAGLSQAYSRANAAGYGQYATGRSLDLENFGSEPIKREIK